MDVSLAILWKCYKENRDNYYRDRLILNYKPFLKIIVNKIYRKLPKTVDVMDLENYGYIGLIDAIKKFDLNRNIKFETYASYRIKGAIIDGVRKQDWLSRTLRSKVKKNNEEYGDDNVEIEENENKGKSVKSDYELENFTMLSTDDPNFCEKGSKDHNSYLSDSYNLYVAGVTDFAEKIENKLFLRKAISKLTAQERRVIYLYYFKGKNFKEIGKSMNITESRISQINKKILLTLKKEINDSVMTKAG
jgi:RNA polymerase sigma factor for flagellar operon FliA